MAKKKTKSKTTPSNSTKVVSTPDFDAINTEAIASALTSVNQAILKVCRLCESKDGPFHNIFDSEKVTAKKIEELMPFWVAENDDLPHKICFRCSAKVEELYEFVQRCVGTQESLRKTIGKTEPLPMKKKTRALWEQSLHKSNMSNDDICHALIKKAMEGIKDIVKPSKDIDKPNQINLNSKIESKSTTDKQEETDDDDDNDEMKDDEIVIEEKNDDGSNVRPLRSNKTVKNHTLHNVSQPTQIINVTIKEKLKLKNSTETFHVDLTDESKTSDETSSKSSENCKPFDIMDHVTMIKVNGVGVLFQCKLCNRNFLKKEVVLSHGCAKTGVPKIDKCNMYVPPEPPKPSTVKYINTRVNADNKNQQIVESKPSMDNENSQPSNPKQNVKKKIGPASKTGRRSENSSVKETESSDNSNNSISNQAQQNPSTTAPQLNFLAVPNMSSRYKILPGPNNTFTLVEDKAETDMMGSKNTETDSISENRKSESPIIIDLEKATDNSKTMNKHSVKSNTISKPMPKSVSNNKQARIENSSSSQPYPVGLFQTNVQVPFTTPAMKKQSYTIVQTGNPNKLLISSKPHDNIEEVSKKRLKKSKAGPASESNKEPFSVILEDATPNKDTSFFTFINVDPLLQPSYVLPTDSIIQESQITTSTQIAKQNILVKENDKYSCNICGESFNREKKLSAHINAHYNVDNDYIDDGPPKKRGKK